MKKLNTHSMWKTLPTVLAHLLFWTCVCLFFVRNSFLRPTAPIYKELLCVLMIALMVYFHYVFLIPKLMLKNKKAIYWIVAFFSVLAVTAAEFWIVKNNITNCYAHSLPPEMFKSLYKIVFFLIFLRDTSFFMFFLLLKLRKIAQTNYLLEKQISAIKSDTFAIEKENLSTQISPNYILNVVSALKTIQDDKERMARMDTLIDILNYYLVFASKDTVNLRQEIVFYQQYVDLEMINHKKGLSYSIISQTIPSHIQVAPLLFQPIIENAFRNMDYGQNALIKFEFTFKEPDTILFTAFYAIDKNIDEETIRKCHQLPQWNRRLELLYPQHYKLSQEIINDNYYQISLQLTVNQEVKE